MKDQNSTADDQSLVARNVKWWRDHFRLTTKEASDRLGVWHSTWSQWESGKRMPSLLNLFLLCRMFNLPLCAILTAEPSRCLACPSAAHLEREIPRRHHL